MQGLTSMWGGIHVGVPQGSIMGPLLFSIYMNDLPNVVQICELNLYADDMEMHYSNANLASTERDLHHDIQSVNLWFCVNLFTLNIRKPNVVLIGSRQKLRNYDLSISVDGKQLSRVSSVKYLDLHIDENLSWHQHTANVVQRVYSRIHCLNHVCPLPIELLAKLYLAFVLPILDYCDVVWTPSSVQHFKCLERLHSRFNSPPSSNDFSAFMTLAEQRWYHAAVQVHRVLHKLSPLYLNATFHYAVDITLRTGWNLHHWFVPRVRTTLAKHSLQGNTNLEFIESYFVYNKKT